MNYKKFLIPTTFFLTGCSSSDEKIVDLSAVVFCLYVAMIGMKYFSPRLVQSKIFSQFSNFVDTHIRHIVIPMYLLSGIFVLSGLYFEDINKILIFVGFSLLIISRQIEKIAARSSGLERQQSIEVITLGAGVIFVLLMLWYYGSDLFAPF